MSRTIDPDSLGFVITDVGRLLRAAVERRIGETGLSVTPGEARALLHVAVVNGSRQAQLAERLGVEPMTVSGYIDRLEQRGLVERRADPSDRRAKCVFLTDAADSLIDEVRGVAASVLDEMLADVDGEHRALLEQALKSMRARLQGALGCERESRPSGEAA